MTTEGPESLSSTAERLLQLERQRAGAPGEVEQRVFERLLHANAFTPVAAAIGGGLAKGVVVKLVVAAVVGQASEPRW